MVLRKCLFSLKSFPVNPNGITLISYLPWLFSWLCTYTAASIEGRKPLWWTIWFITSCYSTLLWSFSVSHRRATFVFDVKKHFLWFYACVLALGRGQITLQEQNFGGNRKPFAFRSSAINIRGSLQIGFYKEFFMLIYIYIVLWQGQTTQRREMLM